MDTSRHCSELSMYNGWRIPPGSPGAPLDHVGGMTCPCSICVLPPNSRLRVFLCHAINRPAAPESPLPFFDPKQCVIDPLHDTMRITEPMMHVLCVQVFMDGRLEAFNKLMIELNIGFKAKAVEGDDSQLAPTKLDGPKCRKILANYEQIVRFCFDHGNQTPAIVHTRDMFLRLWGLWRQVDTDMNTVQRPEYWSDEQHRQICANFKLFGLYWCEAMWSEFTKSLYLHSLVAHGAAYWMHLRMHGLSPGMLSTDAAELRHLAYGRPAYMRAQNAGLGGRPRFAVDAEGKRVIGPDGEFVKEAPIRTIDCVEGCHRSYLSCRELWLLDWGEMNPRCRHCAQWRHWFVCAHPDVKEPPGFTMQYKRRQLHLDEIALMNTGSWVQNIGELAACVQARGEQAGDFECARGCGWTGSFNAVCAHEWAEDCEHKTGDCEVFHADDGSDDEAVENE